MSDRKETPQERWSKKNGYITKGFKMYRSVADEFATACDKAGVSQSAQIVKMMQEFIDRQKEHGD